MAKQNKRMSKHQNGGRITQGSGRIDYNSRPNKYTVDDVPGRIKETGEEIIVGADEYIINSRTAKTVGYDFLDKLNKTGLVGGGGFQIGRLPDSNYQKGGKINKRGAILGDGRGGIGINNLPLPTTGPISPPPVNSAPHQQMTKHPGMQSGTVLSPKKR